MRGPDQAPSARASLLSHPPTRFYFNGHIILANGFSTGGAASNKFRVYSQTVIATLSSITPQTATSYLIAVTIKDLIYMHHKITSNCSWPSGSPGCPDTESNPYLAQKEGRSCVLSLFSQKISVSVMAVFFGQRPNKWKTYLGVKMSKVATSTLPPPKWQVWLPRIKDNIPQSPLVVWSPPPSHTCASNVHLSSRFWWKL